MEFTDASRAFCLLHLDFHRMYLKVSLVRTRVSIINWLVYLGVLKVLVIVVCIASSIVPMIQFCLLYKDKYGGSSLLELKENRERIRLVQEVALMVSSSCCNTKSMVCSIKRVQMAFHSVAYAGQISKCENVSISFPLQPAHFHSTKECFLKTKVA